MKKIIEKLSICIYKRIRVLRFRVFKEARKIKEERYGK